MSKYRTSEIDELCAMFKALSNPQRLRIFLKLTEPGGPSRCDVSEDGVPCCVGDLGGDLDVTPSTVSHHIKELRQSGLIQVERFGKQVKCSASDEGKKRLSAFLRDVLEEEQPAARARSTSARSRRTAVEQTPTAGRTRPGGQR